MKFSKEIRIGNKVVSEYHPVFVIAEAGVNHNGDIRIAKELIDVAVAARADAVKFQAFKADDLILETIEKANYQKKTTTREESQYEMLKRLEVSKKQNQELISYCQKREIIFLSTPFEEKSLNELIELDVPAIKVASTDTNNLMFLNQIARTGKPIILSTGMSYFSEVKMALEEIHPINKNVILLQCTANYPIKDNEANLNVLKSYQQAFEILVGYSDHTVGLGASPYAIPLGARVVEKHFTLDTAAAGPDHSASLSPDDLIRYVREIRRVESFLGSENKYPSYDEFYNRLSLQKCLVATRKITKGEPFTMNNIGAKRTGGKGIPPIYYKTLLEMKATRNYHVNDIIDEK
jgi:sialic acid synthase SpsE